MPNFCSFVYTMPLKASKYWYANDTDKKMMRPAWRIQVSCPKVKSLRSLCILRKSQKIKTVVSPQTVIFFFKQKMGAMEN